MNGGILIVEDEGLIALDLKRELENAGFTVATINDNGAEALLSVERLRPALVLMDIRLRGVQDGIETADLIRLNFHIPVIFVTAFADRETIFRARVTGPFDYIVKPFHGVDFRNRIDMAIEEHKRSERQRVAIEQDKIRLRP
jgi:two-component system, cell cycle sensor histidine kinase and response regulator CckA